MNLSDKIWITRKTRIITEKRLRRNAILSEFSIIFFSLFIVFFSIWNFLHPSQNINLLLIYGAITLLAVSIFLSSQRFNERALAIRNCYIRLNELYFKVKNAEEVENSESIQQFVTSYNDILLNIENHSEYDYLCLRYSLRNNQDTTLPSFSWIDYFNFLVEKLIRLVLIILLFSLPFTLLMIGIRFS